MRKYSKKIKQEVENNIPNLKASIKEKIEWNLIKQNNMQNLQTQVKSKNQTKTKTFNFRFAFISFACVVVLCLAIILPIAFSNGNSTPSTYYVTIDVNPSIRLEIDKNDKVTNQYGLNKDGVILLYKENLVGKTAEEATEIIVNKLNTAGFLDANNEIKLYVKDNYGKESKSKEKSYKDTIQQHLETTHKQIDLRILEKNELEEIDYFYNNNHISEYKNELVNDFKEKLIEQANIKLQFISTLSTMLEYFVINENTQIENFDIILNMMLEFCNKYYISIDADFETYSNINEFYQELLNSKQDLEQIVAEIIEGENENTYADSLKDLFELVEEDLYKEN